MSVGLVVSYYEFHFVSPHIKDILLQFYEEGVIIIIPTWESG